MLALVSIGRRLLDLRRGEGGVSTFGNETVSEVGDFLAFFVGEDALFDLVVVGEGDLPNLAGEGDLLVVCRPGWGIYAMTSTIPCFCSEVKEVWTSDDLESCSNSAMVYTGAGIPIHRISTRHRSQVTLTGELNSRLLFTSETEVCLIGEDEVELGDLL